ncbi:ribosomal large subunit pseudouridine synthase F [Hathewaya proteolytica DSM 3090]|uniref:Pseudouridine synthase n=1 Tax=Hathewaya proteolytica DSM 3090 TaxID=1121331 RepID=A0A1M6P737_9CLOT|nr:23S rRNA pseudouridine(2604) synthase RluF [Hathewaya proteolytica]SHK03763.1 ribosomal large subunit pseudouridine synthase F [Hathewaya proteolytica DSM 3090]
MRLNKFISEKGICSRREADRLIDKGLVKVNGIIAEIGMDVCDDDEILIKGKPIKTKDKLIYMAFNKPVGITCTTDTSIKDNIISYINYPKRIFHIGRLDKPSQGLIFMTNDGDIVNKILRSGNNHEKEYVVAVNKPITDDFIRKMGNGVPILNTVTKKCKIRKEGKFTFRIILTQGLNRQIRRMCQYLGYSVTKLERVRIMNVTLKGLPLGKWRYLTDSELEEIKRLVETSVKTEEASLTFE